MNDGIMHTPAAELGDSCKVLTCGEMPSQLMEGLGANGVKATQLSMDSVPAPAPQIQQPAPSFMDSFKP